MRRDSTKKLTDIITKGKLDFFTFGLKLYADYNKKHSKSKMPAELKKINAALLRLKEKNFINDSGIKIINDTILKQLENTREGVFYIQNSKIKELRKSGKRYTQHPFLRAILVGLISETKRLTGKPKYELIADHLSSQGFEMDSEAIKKTYSKYRDKELPVFQLYCGKIST